jgi:hypothetical protein
MSDETPIADAKVESKPTSGRKKSKSETKAKKKKKSDSHAHRPKSSMTYWIKGIEAGKFKGAELVLAIERVEAYEKEKAQKKLAKSGPNPGNRLRAILNRDPKATAPKVESQPVAKIAASAKPQADEVASLEITDAATESEPMTFDDLMEQLAAQSKNTESIADMAKRIRDVPAEMDPNARRLIDRAWSKVH